MILFDAYHRQQGGSLKQVHRPRNARRCIRAEAGHQLIWVQNLVVDSLTRNGRTC